MLLSDRSRLHHTYLATCTAIHSTSALWFPYPRLPARLLVQERVLITRAILALYISSSQLTEEVNLLSPFFSVPRTVSYNTKQWIFDMSRSWTARISAPPPPAKIPESLAEICTSYGPEVAAHVFVVWASAEPIAPTEQLRSSIAEY